MFLPPIGAYDEVVTRRLLWVVVLLAGASGALGAPWAAGGTASSVATVSAVGSGTLEWSRVSVRARPTLAATTVATLTQFRPDFYPRTVLALEQRPRAGSPTWYRVSVPGRPNGRTGWIPAASVDLRPVDRWLVVYRESRRFELHVGRTVVRRGPVAVGARGMETPLGLFYVQAAFRPKRYPVLGAFAFETSGYSKLSDWPGGGVVGVHGTNTPWLIGHAVSHGCVRLRNEDILFLRTLVGPGVPVKIVRA